jgi:diacylglycerol diphosphate phosphatase/phosphatidate phosphatase
LINFFKDHWQDVLAGSILGTVVSYFAYRQYYPSLASEVSHRPYAPRVARDELPSHGNGHRRESSAQQAYRDDRPTAEDIIDSGPLQGTVVRGGPGTLREAWKDGADEEETTALPPHRQARDGIQLESV